MRVLVLAALVSGLALAGCFDRSGPSAVVDPLPDLVPKSIARVVTVVDARGGMGEPSLGVTPDGVLFTNGVDHDAATGFDSGTVLRSKDGGATWEPLGAPANPWPNFDPDLVVDADGTVWYDILWLGCNTVAVSRDEGETWTVNPAVCNGPVGDRQYVIPTKGGEAYLYYHQLPTFQQTAMRTTDYGATWLPTGPTEGTGPHHLLVNGGSGWGGGGFWNVATGSVFLTYTWFDSDPANPSGESTWSPAASITRDDGLTWEVVKVPNMGGRSHGLSLVVGAADDAGNVYLAWSETTEKDSAVYYAASRDDGKTFGAPVRVDNGTASNVFPAITAGGAGEIAIAYYESNEDGYPSDVSKEATWNVTLAWTRDALGAAPAFERAQLSNHTVKKGPICPDGTSCQGNRQLLDYFSAKRMPDGRVAAVWASTEDVEGKTVNVFAATDAAILAPAPHAAHGAAS